MIISMTKKLILRSPLKSILTIIFSISIIIFIGLYINNIKTLETSLRKLSQTIPVTGEICDISGSKTTGLEIDERKGNQIISSQYVVQAKYTIQVVASNINNQNNISTTLMGCNSIDALPLLYDDNIDFMSGNDSSFLTDDKNNCIVEAEFAKQNNMKVRLHTLIWHKHFPKILANCSKDQIITFLDSYFSYIANRYDTNIFYTIDVLNEIVADINSEEFKQGNVLRNSKWKEKLGDDYYITILKLARQNFPNSNLTYNEYDETNKQKRDKMISIINDIKQEETKTDTILLDSIGLQSHYHEYTTDEEIKATYTDLSQTRKNLQVSEMDITKINIQNSFASQMATIFVISAANVTGLPISATQVVTSSVMGVGTEKTPKGVNWTITGCIAAAWLITIPASALIGAVMFKILILI